MLKIFLVEDEIVIREGIRNNVDWEKEGFFFAGCASDGEMAYPMILKERPDILITDIRMKAYVLSSFLCSIGGICYCMNTMSASVAQATGLEMDAIASSVIGGTLLTGGVGNVFGSFFGVLITGTISTLVKTNGKLLSSWSSIAVAALLCFFIVLQSIFAMVKAKKK